MKLTKKQEMFVEEYIIDLNATQAAIRAGYSKKTAGQIGEQNLKKLEIQQAINEKLAEKKEKLIMKQDEILERLTQQGRREATDYQVVITEKPVTNEKGDVVAIEKLPEIVEVPTQNKDVIKALETLGKYYVMWTDKQEVTQRNIEINIGDYNDEP
ncbi:MULTISPECIES: terminase small subunit [Staphylococcus]|uniref:terminase small subunit n=1 Tax=Staphylococcus TaxID=1279 RepID=UPI001CF80A50|nr:MULTISPECIES: terminase small subunit [Staphylococcus]MCI2919078.1 terminase small subunit [Staphylococcus hominis]MDS3927132.1 terminase small subunit [Staphylococcus hominis]